MRVSQLPSRLLQTPTMNDAHLDPDQIAAYAERRLPAGERPAVEAHLADCHRCRAEAVAAARLLGAARRGRRLAIAVPLVSAAAAMTLWVVTGSTPEPSTLASRLRPGDSAGREGVPELTVHAPADRAMVERAGLVFVWRSSGVDARYRLVLAAPSGEPVWDTTVSDTSVSPPADLVLDRGARYLWYVDALLPDARTATTGVRELTLAP